MVILQHWRPLSSSKGGGDDDDNDDSDNNAEDEGDKAFMESDKAAAFAKPVQRRKKKGLEFRKWKEITPDDNSSFGKESDEDMSRLSQTTRKKKNEQNSKSADKKTASADNSVFASTKVDAKPQLDNSGRGFISSATTMELDTSKKVDLQEKVKDARISDDKEENQFVAEWDQTCSDRMHDYNFRSLDVLKPEQTSLTSTTSLESEIDAENRARVKQMSAEEIAEAQAEIMEKVSPALLKLLQKRWQEKMKKQNSLKSEVVTGSESVNQHVQNTQDAKFLHTGDTSHTVMTPPLENKLDEEKNRTKTSTTPSSSSWNAWSNRVEAIRELRFSLAGDVVDTDRLSVYGMPYLFFLCS